MGDRTQKLTIAAEAVGTQKVADELKNVAAAQGQVAEATAPVTEATQKATEATKGSTEATKEGAEATRSSTAAIGDLSSVLNTIIPGLGQYVSGMVKAGNLLGDFANKGLDLKSVGQSLTKVITDNAGALKLLVDVGGPLVIIVFAITKALEKLRQQWQDATKAMNEYIDAATKLDSERRVRAQTIEDIAASRREGGFTAEEARAAKDQAERVGKRFGFIDEGAVQQAAALVPGLSDIELARVAREIQTGRLTIDPKERAATRQRGIDRQMGRDTEILDREFERETRQREELQAEAYRQRKFQVGGSLDALIALIEENTRGEGVDAGKIARAMQVLDKAESSFNVHPDRDAGILNLLQEALQDAGLASGEAARLNKVELAIARRERQALDAVGPIIINQTINQQHGRFIGSDEAARRKRESNGQAQRERVER